jgi:hypothetical protein
MVNHFNKKSLIDDGYRTYKLSEVDESLLKVWYAQNSGHSLILEFEEQREKVYFTPGVFKSDPLMDALRSFLKRKEIQFLSIKNQLSSNKKIETLAEVMRGIVTQAQEESIVLCRECEHKNKRSCVAYSSYHGDDWLPEEFGCNYGSRG